MVPSVPLCLLNNSNTRVMSYIQSSPPPLRVTQLSVNGQCSESGGEVSDDGGRMKIGNATGSLCFLAALMHQSGSAPAVSLAISQRNSVLYFPSLHSFIYRKKATSLHLDQSNLLV